MFQDHRHLQTTMAVAGTQTEDGVTAKTEDGVTAKTEDTVTAKTEDTVTAKLRKKFSLSSGLARLLRIK